MTIALGSWSGNFEKKLVGIVRIVTGKTKAKLTLQEKDKKFRNGEDSITVLLDELPDRPKLALDDKAGKEYRVRMNQDGDAVEAITPVRGHYSAKLVDLGPHKEGEEPYPKDKPNWGDSEKTHLEFFAVYEITQGAFKGVQLPAYWLHYKFEHDKAKPGLTKFAGNFENAQSTRLFQLRDWGLAHNLWSEDIPWDDNTILPTLLDRALENDVEVEITLDKGYINLVQVPENYEAVDEEFPPVDEDIEDVQDKIHSVKPSTKNGKNKPVDAPAQTYTTRAPKRMKAVAEDDDL